MSYRLLGRFGREGTLPVWGLLLLAVGVGLATALGEAAYYALATGFDPSRLLAADLRWPFLGRPCWVVLLIGLGLGALALLRQQRRLGARVALADAPA